MPIDTSSAPDGASPLWIFAIFLAVGEAVLVPSAVITDGTGRAIFVGCAVGYLLVLFGIFVWLLVSHPANLYAPRQFEGGTSFQDFREGLSKASPITPEGLSLTGSDVGGTSDTPSPTEQTVESDRSSTLHDQVQFEQVLKDRSLKISVPMGADRSLDFWLPVNSGTTMGDVFASVFNELPPFFQDVALERSWGLSFARGDIVIPANAVRSYGRNIADFGLRQGDHLVVDVPETTPRATEPFTSSS